MSVHLQKLEELFKEDDELTVELSEATEPIPFPHMLLSFPSEVNDFEVFMLIISVVEAEIIQAAFESAGEFDLLNVLYPFPYEIEDPEMVKDVSRLLHLLNKINIIGTFGYDEYENRCFYRHSLVLSRSNPDYHTALSTILLVKDILSIYTGAIEDVSTGAITTEALLEKFNSGVQESEEQPS
ncbi:MAG: hypothetical protein Q8K75_04360 [Chlamydiales bacterium]|nr:hypothetical protein [Chlamydiales bacterium]